MTAFRLARQGAVDLTLEGELLADESSANSGKPRWAEERIYKTDTGKWVVEHVARSNVQGEIDKPRVTVCATPLEVRDALLSAKPSTTTGQRYLTDLAHAALTHAAEKDPALAEALVESV